MERSPVGAFGLQGQDRSGYPQAMALRAHGTATREGEEPRKALVSSAAQVCFIPVPSKPARGSAVGQWLVLI